jgi:trans-2-enoyl-CoA reductase
MPKTVLVIGASSGIDAASAILRDFGESGDLVRRSAIFIASDENVRKLT